MLKAVWPLILTQNQASDIILSNLLVVMHIFILNDFPNNL